MGDAKPYDPEKMAARAAAQRGYQEMSAHSSTKTILQEFMKSLGVTSELMRKFERTLRDQSQGTFSPESAFRYAFEGFPFRVCPLPAEKLMEVTRISHLAAKKGGGQIMKAYHRMCEIHIDAVQASLPIIMPIRIPYMDTPHVVHALDSEVVDMFEGVGNFMAYRSEYDYWLFIQPAQHFAQIPFVRSRIQIFLEESGDSEVDYSDPEAFF
jgi:hypothetical protein